MAYARWGMTEGAASTLTGAAGLTETDLDNAEIEIVEWLGWEPDPDAYDPTTDRRAVSFGRAVAWQAAYRQDTPAAADDGDALIDAESVPDYSVTYARPTLEADEIAPRARRYLERSGWTARTRTGRTGLSGRTEPPLWQ